MKDKLITEIQTSMAYLLNNAQLEELRRVLTHSLHNVEITERKVPDTHETAENGGLLKVFIAAKRIEGCSEKSLKYYDSTIRKMINGVDKPVREIDTDDLRGYLADYQKTQGSSKVTIDNMRRIFSSFFGWLEDEDYILKSPVRRIHKIKTEKTIKETFSDEGLELLRDACDEIRDLAMIDLLSSTGMRVGELVQLNREDINFHERECVVFGKGSKERVVYFDARTKIHLLNYIRDYLTMKLGRIPKVNHVYEEFKRYHLNCEFGSVRDLCQDIYTFSKYYTDMCFCRSSEPALKACYSEIQALRSEVVYPFLLRVHHDQEKGLITLDELIEIIRMCINYVLRRAVCNIPTNSMNKTFATLKNFIKTGDYLNSIKAAFVLMESYKEFPTDEKFVATLTTRDVYNMRIRNYILGKLENFQNKAPITIENYTIEHIMPQNLNLSPEWISDLGHDWREVQKTYLHTLGNLTLTAYNSEMSDSSFTDKLNMEGGFKQSALRINSYVVLQDTWNAEKIQERARPRLKNKSCTKGQKFVNWTHETI